jgi:hypothetical protein
MGVFQNNLMGAAAAAASAGDGFYDYQIANSYRSMAGVGYFTRTPSSAGNRKKYTISFWFKRTLLSSTVGEFDIFCNAQESSTTNYTDSIRFQGDGDKLQIAFKGTLSGNLITTRVFRDTSAWMHLVCAVDTTQTTAANRVKLYINGEQETDFDTETYPAQDYQGGWCNNREHALGRFTGASYTTIGNFYMANFALVDGTQLAPTSFGTSKNGVWIPDDLSELTWGTNGTWVRFESSSDLGNDSSGNNNDWTNNSVATHDQMLDSPTFGNEGSANFPTINPLVKDTNLSALTEGNLKFDLQTNNRGALNTFEIPLTGKWYYEMYAIAGSAKEVAVGINGADVDLTSSRGGKGDSNCYGIMWSQYSGSNYFARKIIAGTESTGSSSLGTTDNAVLGVAVNRDDDEIKVYYNNNLLFTNAISATVQYFPWVGVGGGTDTSTFGVLNFGQEGTFSGNKTAGGNADGNGYGNFFYSPPTGHLALCAANLPTADEIDPAQTDDDYPQKLFKAVPYTGNDGSPSNNITFSFKPDMAIMKMRGNTGGGYGAQLWDTTRGDDYYMYPGGTAGSVTSGSDYLEFVSTGLKLDNNWDGLNHNGETYIAHGWRANGGTTSSNTTGDITSTVQVDPSGCFSIVKYTGTLSASGVQTVGHGLSKAPSYRITKGMDKTGNWWVFSDGQTNWNYGMNLNSTSTSTDKSGNGSMSAPTSTVFSTNYTDGLNDSTGNEMIAYCFAKCEGYISMGSYEGNGNADGTFVYTGHSPAYILLKSLDSADDWIVYDNKRDGYNVTEKAYAMNRTNAEATSNRDIDILSNGFKFRTSNSNVNGSNTYLYIAMAHNPFKYATAR